VISPNVIRSLVWARYKTSYVDVSLVAAVRRRGRLCGYVAPRYMVASICPKEVQQGSQTS